MAVTVKFSDGCLAVADARVFCNSRPLLAEALLQQLQQLPQVSFASLNLSQGFCRIGWQSDLTAKQAADGFIADGASSGTGWQAAVAIRLVPSPPPASCFSGRSVRALAS